MLIWILRVTQPKQPNSMDMTGQYSSVTSLFPLGQKMWTPTNNSLIHKQASFDNASIRKGLPMNQLE